MPKKTAKSKARPKTSRPKKTMKQMIVERLTRIRDAKLRLIYQDVEEMGVSYADLMEMAIQDEEITAFADSVSSLKLVIEEFQEASDEVEELHTHLMTIGSVVSNTLADSGELRSLVASHPGLSGDVFAEQLEAAGRDYVPPFPQDFATEDEDAAVRLGYELAMDLISSLHRIAVDMADEKSSDEAVMARLFVLYSLLVRYCVTAISFEHQYLMSLVLMPGDDDDE